MSKKIDLTLFCAKDTMRQHWKKLGRPDIDDYLRKHAVIPCAVLLSPSEDAAKTARKRMRDSLDISDHEFVLGSVSRPDVNRLDYMIVDVFARLTRQRPNCRLITRSFPDLLADKLQLKCGAQYINLPPTNDPELMRDTFCAMDVLVHFSSMGESFGLAIAEAMRCGIPVIANETPQENNGNAQCELVRHGENGFLANNTTSALAYLIRLAEDKNLKTTLDNKAREIFNMAPLSPESIIRQFEREIFRIAYKKGLVAERDYQKNPGDDELRDFLENHHRRYTAKTINADFGDCALNAFTDAKRIWWKIRRKFV